VDFNSFFINLKEKKSGRRTVRLVMLVVISDGLRWVGEIGEVTEGMNLFGFVVMFFFC
jgi:hypothetical protein